MQRYMTEQGSIHKGELVVCCENEMEMIRERKRSCGKLGGSRSKEEIYLDATKPIRGQCHPEYPQYPQYLQYGVEMLTPGYL